MTRSPPEGLDKGRIVDKGIVAVTGRLAHGTHFRVSTKLFWVGTGPEMVSKQDSMWKCSAKVPEWPETEPERPEVTGAGSQG